MIISKESNLYESKEGDYVDDFGYVMSKIVTIVILWNYPDNLYSNIKDNTY